jgi:aspartate carbamoyltransferase catalytic subunit
MNRAAYHYSFDHEHLLSIEGLSPLDITHILDLADRYAEATRAGIRPDPVLKGKVVVNLFFEPSTRTRRASRSPASGSAPTS